MDQDKILLWSVKFYNWFGYEDHDSNGLTSDGKVLSSFMNNFFKEKVQNLKKKVQPNLQESLKYTKRFRKKHGIQTSQTGEDFNFRNTDWMEVRSIVEGLTNTSSTGVDEIGTSVLKNFKDVLVPGIVHVINLCISNSYYPEAWKIGLVSPIPKKGI